MTGLGGACAAAGLLTAVVAAVGAVHEARRRDTPSALSRALIWIGVLLWASAAPLALFTGSPSPVILLIPGTTLTAAGVGFTVLVRADLVRLLSPWRIAMAACVPVGVLAAARSPLVLSELHPSATTGWDFTPGPLSWLLVLWVCLYLLVVAVIELATAMQAVGPLRTDVVVDGVRVLVGTTVVFGLLVVAPWRPLLALVPTVVAVGMLVGWRAGGRRGSGRWMQVSTSQVLDRISDAVVVLGPDGSVADANCRARTLLLTPGFSGRSRRPRLLLDQELRVAITADGERTVTLTGGRAVRVRVVTVKELGYPVARIVSARDITELEQVRAELHELAGRDPLTGLRNRRHLAGKLAAIMGRAAESDEPLTLAMVDLDNLKQLNDVRGHQVGDQTLRAVADILRTGRGPDDLVVRTGGDEFIVLMPGTGADQALDRAEAWRRHAARTDPRDPAPLPPFTLSVGIAQMTSGMTSETFQGAADDALYLAKASGRDQVRLSRLVTARSPR
ncbi:MAG: diguanylate cyclase [Actinobacteria bacterium]|nr:diguanylate cyclase [Actinomycetota bacterium]MCG2802633.1 diguanylate cyclase [Cellulomonas sp.]